MKNYSIQSRVRFGDFTYDTIPPYPGPPGIPGRNFKQIDQIINSINIGAICKYVTSQRKKNSNEVSHTV